MHGKAQPDCRLAVDFIEALATFFLHLFTKIKYSG